YYFNQQLVDQLIHYQQKMPARTILLFNHILNAHHIWNARIVGESSLYTVHEIHAIESLKEIDRHNYDKSLVVLDQTELDKIIVYQNSKGDNFSNTVRDILFHVINHTTHHRAQIISDFRQQEIEPLITDYIFYK